MIRVRVRLAYDGGCKRCGYEHAVVHDLKSRIIVASVSCTCLQDKKHATSDGRPLKPCQACRGLGTSIHAIRSSFQLHRIQIDQVNIMEHYQLQVVAACLRRLLTSASYLCDVNRQIQTNQSLQMLLQQTLSVILPNLLACHARGLLGILRGGDDDR